VAVLWTIVLLRPLATEVSIGWRRVKPDRHYIPSCADDPSKRDLVRLESCG